MQSKKDSMQLVQNILPPIISLSVFIVIALLMATTTKINHVMNRYFWIQTSGAVVCLILTFVVWTPTGERMAWNKSKVINNKRLYDYRANYIVSHQMFTTLTEFTKKKNIEKKEEIIQQILADGTGFLHNNGNIDYWVYQLYIKKEKTPEEEQRCQEVMASYTEKQQKLIKKLAVKKIKFKHLSPQDLVMGRGRTKGIVNKDTSKFYEISYMLLKSIWGLFTSCFSYFIIIEPNESFGYQQIIMITMWFFTFLSAVYSAIKTGYNAIYIRKNQYNIAQGILCGEFMTYAQIPASEMNPPETL